MLVWSGRELSNSGTCLLAGLLFGLSPGLLLFSTLLLAHHPTLTGLTFFLWAFLRMMRTGSLASAALAGAGLSFAMICRPMTAAGFALPFGLFFLWWAITGRWVSRTVNEKSTINQPWTIRLKSIIAMGIPITMGFALVLTQNTSITGHALKSPYQVYTDTYTPRHVYGFNNVERGEKNLGPKVIDNYDRWAKNLTPELALENVKTRFLSSWRWTLGVVPLLISSVIYLLTPKAGDHRWKLIALSILSLHLAHIPYWFDGIMGWHYVFETGPLWLLLVAESTRRLFLAWNKTGHWMLNPCWLLFLAVAVSVNLWTLEPVWPARLDRGVAELKFPRNQYKQFRDQVETLRNGRDVIVFVLPDPADRSMDYVTNSPQLNGPVLVARLEDRSQLRNAASHFSNRLIFLFDAKTKRMDVPDLDFNSPVSR